MCISTIVLLEQRLSDALDKDFKIPKTRNNYKGDEVLQLLIPGIETSKSRLVDDCFKSRVPVLQRRASVASAALTAEALDVAATVNPEDEAEQQRKLEEEQMEAILAEKLRMAEDAWEQKEEESAESERERLEEEALIAAVQGRVLLYPTPGFVLKSLSADGNKVFVNVCGSFSVSDVVSTQGVQGCPYMICYAGDKLFLNIDDSNVIVYHAIVHPKYVHAALASPDEIRLKVNLML